jgi:predicted membrane channel-forming protein YqfA (hemolysin III family)
MTAPAAASNDKVTLYGVLGIVGAFCCWPLGVVFAILCLTESKKYGKQPTLAYVAFGILALGLVLNIVFLSTGVLANMMNR